MRFAALVIGLALFVVSPAWAEEDQDARAARWQELKQAMFGDRVVADGAGIISLVAPGRALDAALVPVTVHLAPDGRGGKVKAVWLLVDGNPSPLAGTFKFGPAADPRTLKTRVRVDQYTLIHAVAETEDGRLFASESFVKAAGGCSAPSTKDAKLAMSRMGQMRLRLDGEAPLVDGEPATAHLLISHPNNNGMQMDQVTRHFVPARYIQTVTVQYGDTLVLSVDADISLSEDPVITFGFVPQGAGPMRVEMQDSTQTGFRQEFSLAGRS
ncbi:MAG: quinoprotein dehydrogenase-associated SoxYZ-like carrier [Gemmatimonadaceae bacterium]|nr:quinoprotein dehydrogenase-associated SoxYZ-like carrier [Acetobacteraceae bacterium]